MSSERQTAALLDISSLILDNDGDDDDDEDYDDYDGHEVGARNRTRDKKTPAFKWVDD